MAPPSTTTNATATPNPVRVGCTISKRILLSIANLIVLIVTCIYISHAYQHYKVISENPTILKNPYGAFDLSYEKVGYAFAIGRAIFLFVTMFLTLGAPEWLLFLFTVLNLVFEIPMGAVANSNFGYLVTFSELDLSPPTVLCYASAMSTDQWGFYTAYAQVVGNQPYNICQEFVHEGSLLRASLLFAWFTIWISWFIISLLGVLGSDNKWNGMIVNFVGYEFNWSWNGFKQCFTPRLPKLSFPCGRRKNGRCQSGSESSTLADEAVTVNVSEKV